MLFDIGTAPSLQREWLSKPKRSSSFGVERGVEREMEKGKPASMSEIFAIQ